MYPIQHVVYINLDSRPDRRIQVENELTKIGIPNPPYRFAGVQLPQKIGSGAIGCSMSHLKCLEMAKENNWDMVMIVEDDIQFTKPLNFRNQLIKFLKNHPPGSFNVLLLAGNNIPPYKKIDNTCVQVGFCQTTTGYIVCNHYYDTLIENYRAGIRNLIREPEKGILFAIDKFWYQLQERDKWLLLVPLSVTQHEDFSDIEQKVTNYHNMMLDIDKESLVKRGLKMPYVVGPNNELKFMTLSSHPTATSNTAKPKPITSSIPPDINRHVVTNNMKNIILRPS